MKTVGRMTVLILCLLFIAIGPVSASNGIVEVVIFQSNEALYQEVFDAFEAKTGIKVEPQWYTGNQGYKWETTITRVTGGVSPDVVTATSTEYVGRAALGLIAPLDAYIARDKASLDGIVPMLVEAMRWRGQLYQLPYGASSQALAYNANLFEKAGVPTPPSNWNNPNWTWEAYLDTARKLTKKNSDGSVTQWGTASLGWLSLPYKWGGDYLDAEMRQFTGLDQRVLDAWQATQDLSWRYEVAPKPGMPGGNLLQGGTAMAHYHSYSLQNLVNSGQPIVYGPWFKVGSNRAVGTAFPMGMALLESARNKDNGWEFIKFTTLDPVGNFLWNQAAGALPGLLQAHPRWLASMQQYKDTNIATIIDLTTQYAALETWRALTEQVEFYGFVGGAFTSVMNNEKSPRQAMEEVFDAANGAVQRGKQ